MLILDLPVDQIKITDRYRQQFDEEGLISLAEDIQARGLIHALTVRKDGDKYVLVCGERRYRAIRTILKWPTVPCSVREDLTQTSAKVMEASENIHRHSFTWWEESWAIRDIHRALQAEHGVSSKGGGGWTLEMTAKEVGYNSPGSIHRMIEIANFLDRYPEAIMKCSSGAAAIKFFKEAELRILLEEKARRAMAKADLGTPESEDDGGDSSLILSPIKPVLVNADSRDWVASTIPENTIPLIILDPWYGDNIEDISVVQRASYDVQYTGSSKGIDWTIELHQLLKILYNVATDGAHCYMFFGMSNGMKGFVRRTVDGSGWKWDEVPLIWYKGDIGAGRDFSTMHIPDYEPILFMWKGDKPRPFASEAKRQGSLGRFIGIKGLTGAEKKHPFHKPFALYAELIQESGIPGTYMLDPCGGSGESGRAAIACGITPILIEREKAYFDGMVSYVNEEVKE